MSHGFESAYVCERCGLAVYSGRKKDGSKYWKHATGGGAGRTPRHMRHEPVPVERGEWHADVDAVAESIRRFLGRQS